MAKKVADGGERHAAHDQPGSEPVPEIVEVEVYQPGLPTGAIEGMSDVWPSMPFSVVEYAVPFFRMPRSSSPEAVTKGWSVMRCLPVGHAASSLRVEGHCSQLPLLHIRVQVDSYMPHAY